MALSNLRMLSERKLVRRDADEGLGREIAKAAAHVFRMIGPGLDRRVYKQALIAELESAGFNVESDVTVSIHFRGRSINPAFYIDLLVDNAVMIFVKSGEKSDMDAHTIRTYLKQAKKNEAFMFNFGVPDFKHAITHARVKTGTIYANKNVASSVN